MTKALLAAFAAFPFLAAAADLAPGTVEVAGMTGLALSSGSQEVSREVNGPDKTDTTELSIGTSAAYYLIPNVGIGLGGGYRYAKTERSSPSIVGVDRTTTSAYAVGPVLTVQIPVASQLAVFARGQVSLVRGSSTVRRSGLPNDYVATTAIRGSAVAAQAGVKYFPVPSVSFDAALAWARERLTEPSPTETASSLGVSAGVSVYLGGGR